MKVEKTEILLLKGKKKPTEEKIWCVSGNRALHTQTDTNAHNDTLNFSLFFHPYSTLEFPMPICSRIRFF